MDQDISGALQAQVASALHHQSPLRIQGGGSKSFYGNRVRAEPINVTAHTGILSYEPTELVITARAGTPLRVLEETLAQHRQMLPFEPPHFGPGATLGGTVATGLSGPRRPFTGAVRDYVLGVKLLSGRGEIVSFGGQVMKNVAGYDVSRLVTGSLGMLGIILEVSLKVLPLPECEHTVSLEQSPSDAIDSLCRLRALSLPLSGACYYQDQLHLRLSGGDKALAAGRAHIGGTEHAVSAVFWRDLREHSLPFFGSELPLWRLSLVPDAPPAKLQGEVLIDWAGAQRWIMTDAPPDIMHAYAARRDGHATLFRAPVGFNEPRFHPLPDGLLALHKNLKSAFDPQRLLNPGIMYPEL